MLEQPWLSLFFYPYKRDCSADYVEQTEYDSDSENIREDDVELKGANGTKATITLDVPNADLWSAELPNLYTLRIIQQDEQGHDEMAYLVC
jgi:beta-galactosidase/beta-glucuronidase